MPRKRATKVSKRKKPKCPEGDEGLTLTEEERLEKLEVFTKDFDMKFNETVKKYQDHKEKMLNSVESRLHCQLMQLPAFIRKMKLQDFIDLGGTVEAALAPTKTTTASPSASFSVSGRLAQTISKLNPKILPTCDVIHEEDEATPLAEKRPLRKNNKTTVKKTTRAKRGKVNDSYMAPPSTSKTRRTPASRTLSSSGWPTPQITPKFDPRLPYTPAMIRDPKPGERILSMAGSPISNPTDTGTVKKTTSRQPSRQPSRHGRLRTLTVKDEIQEELENIVIPDNPTDIKNMRTSQIFKVMNVFSNILKQSSGEDEVY